MEGSHLHPVFLSFLSLTSYFLPSGLDPAPGDMLGGGRGGNWVKLCPETLQMPCLSLTTPDMAEIGRKGTVQPEPHSTFVFNAKDCSASPQMSHREEVLCKMTPRIRINVSPHTVLDTSSHGICDSGSLFTLKGFRIKPLSFHYLLVLGEEKLFLLGTFSILLCILPVSLEARGGEGGGGGGQDLCFTDKAAEAQSRKSKVVWTQLRWILGLPKAYTVVIILGGW